MQTTMPRKEEEDEEEDIDDSSSVESTTSLVEEGNSSNEALAKKETNAVARSKLLVYLALLVAASAVAFTIFYVMTQEENEDFESQVRRVVCMCVSAAIYDRCQSHLLFYALVFYLSLCTRSLKRIQPPYSKPPMSTPGERSKN